MTKPEQLVVNAIVAYVSTQPDSFIVKTHSSGLSKKQLDLVGSLNGQPFWIDAKALDGKPSKLQLGLVQLYQRGGYVSGVVSSLDEFKELFNSAKP